MRKVSGWNDTHSTIGRLCTVYGWEAMMSEDGKLMLQHPDICTTPVPPTAAVALQRAFESLEK